MLLLLCNYLDRPSSAHSTSSSRASSDQGYGYSGRKASPRPSFGNNNDNNNNNDTGSGVFHPKREAAYSPRPIQQQNSSRGGAADARSVAAKALSNQRSAKDIVEKVRARVVERGGSTGIRTLSKLLKIMDDNGDHKLSRDEFKYGLRDYGIDLTPMELEECFLYFDRDRNGSIDISEFLVGLVGSMNPRRKRIVRMAFDILDKDSSGVVTVDEVNGR